MHDPIQWISQWLDGVLVILCNHDFVDIENMKGQSVQFRKLRIKGVNVKPQIRRAAMHT